MIYIWARQTSDRSVQVISSAISVVTAALTVSAPATGTAGSALAITGTVSPAADAVNVALATQNETAPASGWTAAVTNSGSFAASLTPVAAGTYYVWAQDAASGLTAVSGAITLAAQAGGIYSVNNPGGTNTHGVGSIGINGGISPPQSIATQVALSTSGTVAPTTGWQSALVINNNSMWAIYYPTPAAPGDYYVWVETAAGDSQTVSTFTLTVS
jgi:hypothetical protein